MSTVNIFGHFGSLDRIQTMTLLDVTEFDIYTALNAFAAQEQIYLQEQMAALADFGTDLQTTFGSGTGGQLQPIGEYNMGEATKNGQRWSVAYPIRAFADRKLYTTQYLDTATLAELNQHAIDAAVKDIQTMHSMLLQSLLQSTNYTFSDEVWPGENLGDLTIRRLANNDGSPGSIYWNGTEFPVGTAQHYITSGTSAVADSCYNTLHAKLMEIGYDADIVYVVSMQTGVDTRNNCTTFVHVPVPGIVITGNNTFAVVNNPRAIGRIAYGEVVVWPQWPDNYIYAYDRSKPKPVRFRQHRLAKYQGFKLVADETTGGERPGRPLLNKYWQRIAGAGIRNRMNGFVMQVTTSGTYTDPTGI